jgi:hypothetical protein
MITLENVVHKLELWATAHGQIRKFSHGQEPDIDHDKLPEYPLMHAVYTGISPQPEARAGAITYNFTIFFVDKPTIEEDKAGQALYTINDCQMYALDLVATLKNEDEESPIFGDDFMLTNWNLNYIQEASKHVLFGAMLEIGLTVAFTHNYCDVPIAPIHGDFDPCTLCNVILGKTAAQILACLSEEQEEELTLELCEASGQATYQNSDGTFSVDIPSGDTFVSDDITVTEADGSETETPSNKDVTCAFPVIRARSTDGVYEAFELTSYPTGGNADLLEVELRDATGDVQTLPSRLLINFPIILIDTIDPIGTSGYSIFATLFNILNSDGFNLKTLNNYASQAQLTVPDIPLLDDNGTFNNLPTPAQIALVGEIDTATYDNSNGRITITPVVAACDPVTIEINAVDEGDVPSGDTAEINLVDDEGDPVTPTAVTKVGNVFTVEVPSGAPASVIPNRVIPPFSAVIDETGDLGWHWNEGTYDYDDGAGIIQELDPTAGAEHFFRLKHDNMFGNKYRFTDDQGVPSPSGRFNFDGTTSIPNSTGATPAYFIDHLTGLGYTEYPVASVKQFDVALNLCNIFSLGGYSDFRMPADVEILSLCYVESFIRTTASPDLPFARGGSTADSSFDPTAGGVINICWVNRVLDGRGREVQNIRLRVSDAPFTTTTGRGTYAVRTHF